MRSLSDRIVLTPVCRDGKETLSITLRGDLAGIHLASPVPARRRDRAG